MNNLRQYELAIKKYLACRYLDGFPVQKVTETGLGSFTDKAIAHLIEKEFLTRDFETGKLLIGVKLKAEGKLTPFIKYCESLQDRLSETFPQVRISREWAIELTADRQTAKNYPPRGYGEILAYVKDFEVRHPNDVLSDEQVHEMWGSLLK